VLWDSLFQEAEQAGLAPAIALVEALSFREFIALVNPRYRFYRHCEELIAVLQRVADDELRRVMVFEPPRHGKSELVSRLFPAYYLYRHPERFVGIASYGADLAYTLSRAARENFTRGDGVLHKASRAVKHWLTEAGGGLWAAGVGGPATDKGFHLGIIDDPLKDAKQAQSETIREAQKDWYGSVWSTREEPNGAQIVVQTRWHEDDLSGYLLSLEDDEPESWYIVNLPAIAEPPPTFPTTCTVHPDWRAEGEPLCEERYPLQRLTKLAQRIGEYFFGALFQQRPRPRDGGMFKRGVEIVAAVPTSVTRIRYWDKAGAAPGKGDYTVGALLAKDAEGNIFVEDVVRGQWQADERNRVIRQTAELDKTRGKVTIWIEQPPGLAKEATEAVIKLLQGFSVYPDPVKGDKAERAEPFAAQWQAGNVKLVAGAWNRAYVEELVSFPTAAHDDQVDASAGAFNKLAVEKKAESRTIEGLWQRR
jgi:predicted phage terminase large subunit-like protein